MNILGIDTSGGTCCAAFVSDGIIRGEMNINYNKTHSQVLMPMLDTIKSMTELDLKSIDAIAVAAGPGSFTGLRIGSATAKGLAMSLDVPIIPVPTLEAIAYRAYGFNGIVCPIMDARRSQVYTAAYEFVPQNDEDEDDSRCLKITEVIQQEALPIEDIADKLNALSKPVMFLGDGVPVFRERLEVLMEVPYFLAPSHMLLQSGGAVAARGEELFNDGVYESAAEHKPFYLRKPQAEREREEQAAGQAGGNKAIVKNAREHFEIRPMKNEDLDQVEAGENASHAIPWSRNTFEMDIKLSKDSMIRAMMVAVHKETGKIAGHVCLLNIAGEATITNITAYPEFRGQGLGSFMLETIMEEGKYMGAEDYTLEVRAGNETAISMYTKAGFKKEAVRKAYYQNPEEDAIIMWLRNNGENA